MRFILAIGLAFAPTQLVAQEFAQESAAADSNAPGAAWHSAVHDAIQRQEYEFHAVSGESDAWSAPNRSQSFRSRITRNGLELFPRDEDSRGEGAPWKLELRTNAFGRLDQFEPLSVQSVSADGSRAVLAHGPIREWFENRAAGLEQGWTIPSRPDGELPLWIGLEVRGLSLRIDDSGDNGVFVDASGVQRLRYTGLHAFDATGKEIGARFRSSANGVGIEVDDAQAEYPITVDPIFGGGMWFVDSNQTGAELGLSVSTAGDVNGDGYSDVIMAAHLFDNGEVDEGRVFVYLGSAAGLAATPAWNVESNQAGAAMGWSVATAGDVNGDGFSDVIVGAVEFDGSFTDEGRAYLYLGSATGLATSPAWTISGGQDGAALGLSVSTAGDVNADGYSDVIVGAWKLDNGETDEGRAFVYLGSAAGLASTPQWSGESNQASANFGYKVGTAGDIDGDGYSDVIVGSPHYDGGQTDEGRAYVFRGSAAGVLSTAAWTFESDQANAYCGAVSTAGDVNGDGYSDVIVGARSYSAGQAGEGRGFVFHGSAAGLSTTPAWTGESDQAGAEFGVAVATAGDVNGDGFADVIVGVRRYDNGQTDEGTAYVYLGSASGLSTTALWSSEANQPLSFWGTGVAPAGDVNGDGYSDVIIGAHLLDYGEVDEGQVVVFMGSASGLASDPSWTTESDQPSSNFGFAIAPAGDVNGDGFDDVLVGASAFDNGQAQEGRVYLFSGAVGGLSASTSWTFELDQIDAFLGSSVASAGDVNGDGFADVIIGAPGYDNGQADEGRVLLFLGTPSGLGATPSWSVEGDQDVYFLGRGVSSAGDVNGDGYSDVIVGGDGYTNGQSHEGRVSVYLGSSAGLDSSPAWTAESNQPFPGFGSYVACAGDVNGDGYSDVLVAAPSYNTGTGNNGAAFLYSGSALGLSAVPTWSQNSLQPGAVYAAALASAGDVNGDGFSDVIIGAHGASNATGQSLEGLAFLYYGSATGLSTTAAWIGEQDQPNSRFGYSLSSAGDVNGDGFADVIIGSPYFNHGSGQEGRAFLYLGSSGGLALTAAWTADSNQSNAFMGGAVCAAGDVNGDGYSDVIVSAPFYDNGQLNEGKIWLYLGNEGRGGALLNLQQRRSSDLAPVALLGRSDSFDSIRLQARLPRYAVPSSSSERAALVWEIKPLGTPFDGTNLGRSPLEQALSAGNTLTFNELVTGLTQTAPYHWRLRIETGNPFYPHTPWTSMSGNAPTESKFRTLAGVTVGAPFCFGDGTGISCPCSNNGSLGNGCSNSAFTSGAKLSASGSAGASAGTDTLTLTVTNIQGPALFFQGTGQYGGGLGILFGDGLLCAGGVITRMGVVFPSGSSASYPGGLTPSPIHLAGATAAGDIRHYQAWYRDSAPFCAVQTYNLSNGLSIWWLP